MTPPLFFLDSIGDGDVVLLAGEEGRHAARVRRLQVGEEVLVADGRGGVAACSVSAVLDDGLELQVTSRSVEPEPSPRLVVVQALPKGDRAELAVEVMTELGVDVVVPWAASRSITQWQGPRGVKALDRWRRTAREAAKQSRRARLPEIGEPSTTPHVGLRITAVLETAGAALVLDAAADDAIGSVPLPTSGDLVVVVGPEGGIAPDELTAFEAAGARAVRLGAPVLRTSSAGAAALAALSLRLGRWG